MQQEVFEKFDDFFNWYIAVISMYAPDFRNMNYSEVQNAIPKMTSAEIDSLNKHIESLQPLPKGVELVCNDNESTLYSCFNKARGKVQIAYPTIVKFWVRYPKMLKAAIQHEFGHILNGDIYQQANPSHSHCINICMDVRINQNIDRDAVNQMYRCLFTFRNEYYEASTPEVYFPKLGLPISLKGKYSWRNIHDKWHEVFGHHTNLPLKKGDYIVTIKSINGNPVPTFGIIVSDDKEKGTYAANKFIDSIQVAWKGENYIELENIFNSFGLSDYSNGDAIILLNKLDLMTDGIIADNLIFQTDFLKAIPPRKEKSIPKIGDFVITIKDIDGIKSGTFGQVKGYGLSYSPIGSDSSGTTIVVSPLTELFQEIFNKRDYSLFKEKLLTEKLTEDSEFEAVFPSEAVVIQSPNYKESGGGEKPNTDAKNPPKLGDVVFVKKNNTYGIIENIEEDFTFVITEITKEQAITIIKSRA